MRKLTKFAPTLTGAIVRTCKKVSIRYFTLNAGHFIKYMWLLKDSNGKLICKPCTQFPEISKQSDKFVKGWAGNKQRFKDELIASNSIQKTFTTKLLFPNVPEFIASNKLPILTG